MLIIPDKAGEEEDDNVVTKYAELCDSVIWVGSKYKGIRKSDFDEEIIKSVESLKLSDKY